MTDPIRPTSRAAILEAAFSVFSRDPSAAISEIARQAGVGRATLHRHFSSRDDLVGEMARIAVAEMDAAVEAACKDAPSYGEAVRLSLAALIPLGDRHGFLAIVPLADDPALLATFNRQRRETAELVQAAKQEAVFDRQIPTPWIVQVFDHLLYAGWESVKAGETTPSQAAELAWRTLTNGLGPFQKGDVS